MAKGFAVAMDWSVPGKLPQSWLTRNVTTGGFARFRCETAGIELYVDSSGMYELRDINSDKVLYRRPPRS